MSWVSVLEMAHALNSTEIFHQLISVVTEEKDMEHFSIQDSREVILINIFIFGNGLSPTTQQRLAN